MKQRYDLSHLSYHQPGDLRRESEEYRALVAEAKRVQRFHRSPMPECTVDTPRGTLECGDEILPTDLPKGIEDLLQLENLGVVNSVSDRDLLTRNLPAGEETEFVVAPRRSVISSRRGIVDSGMPIHVNDYGGDEAAHRNHAAKGIIVPVPKGKVRPGVAAPKGGSARV